MKPERLFIICNILGFGLLIAGWLSGGDIVGFFLMLFMMCMALLRWRFPKTRWSVILDVVICMVFSPVVLVLAMFSAFYYRVYIVAAAVVFTLTIDVYAGLFAAWGGITGLFLGMWKTEREQSIKWRDSETGRYYQMEALQNDLISATAQIERMTVVSERARIAREIHDNAGHEIVAAYMSLQTARAAFNQHSLPNPDAIALYDAALERLDKGANKIREAVHNLAPVTALGVEALQDTCKRFPSYINFQVFGNTAHIPVHVWSVLESCLNEALTNAVRHATPQKVDVSLDATPHIIRLSVENDGVITGKEKHKSMGNGLRNLRHRVAAIGGSLAINTGDIFHVICVIPVSEKV